MAVTTKKLTTSDAQELIQILKTRFTKNMGRHKGIKWKQVEALLHKQPHALWSLQQMEDTGGEPDVVEMGQKSASITYIDCAAESPKGRRSVCYDHTALHARKENKPANSAQNMAQTMGIRLLTEDEYRHLQGLGEFDVKTSSWIQTPDSIRNLGGALFCDRRFNHVFTYHNGAESYYAARGFRGILIL